MTVVFFDVIFLKASLQPSNLAQHLGKPDNYQTVSLFPAHHDKTQVAFGFSDLGSTSWQSEPTRHFVANSLNRNESIFWNPYSAAGSLGPETLVDIKTSPHTLIGAWLFDASASSFDFGLLVIFSLSSAALIAIGRQFLGMGHLASIMLAVGFLLGGYATPNFNSQNGQSYFIAPIVLLSLFYFYQQGTVKSWVISLFAQAMILLITLIPITFIALLTVHGIALAWAVGEHQGRVKLVCKKAALQFFTPLIAILLLAPLWFPIFAYLVSGDLVDDYTARTLHFYNWDNLLNLFTPRHYWEHYNGIRPTEILNEAGVKDGRAVLPHLGIAAIFLVFSMGLAKQKRLLGIGCFLLIITAYGRNFGYPPFHWMELIPGAGIFGRQYWGVMTSLSFAILLGLSFHRLESERPNVFGLIIALAFFITAFSILFQKLGWPNQQPYSYYLKITLGLVLASTILIVLLTLNKPEKFQKGLTIILALVVFTELFYYINHLRPQRYDIEKQPPEFVTYLQQNLKEDRVFSIGDRNVLHPEFGAMYGLRQISTANSSTLPWYKEYYMDAFGSDWPHFLNLGSRAIVKAKAKKPAKGEQLLDPLALDFLSVKYAVMPNRNNPYKQLLIDYGYTPAWEDRKTLILENPKLLSGVRLVRNIEDNKKAPLANRNKLLTTVTTQNQELISKSNLLNNTETNTQDSIKTLKFTNTEINYEVKAASAAVMVINEVWHPGWSATINGEPTPVYQVNGAFRGIWVPKGEHHVSLSYTPQFQTMGIFASLTLLLICFILIIIEQINSKRTATPNDSSLPKDNENQPQISQA